MTHHKAEAFLEVDISDAAVSFEEPLHILLPGRRAQAADENTTSTHVDVVGNVRVSANRSQYTDVILNDEANTTYKE